MKLRIYYKDTDAGGIVYHSNYIDYCERARSEFFFESGVIFNPNSHFVVASLEAKYHKPSFLGDILEIKTDLKELKKASMVMRQEIYKISNLKGIGVGDLIFTMDIKVAYLINQKPGKIPENILKLMQEYKKR